MSGSHILKPLALPKDTFIDSHNFLNRVWKPVIEALVRDGKVQRYLPQYNIRHTFITLALEHGLDAKDVARLVGNTPKMIYRHYAGNKRELFVPEFYFNCVSFVVHDHCWPKPPIEMAMARF